KEFFLRWLIALHIRCCFIKKGGLNQAIGIPGFKIRSCRENCVLTGEAYKQIVI
ncbi:MAG: hypothetical protein ACI8P3_004549, partial [Saprospiraceae bacterium]